MNAFRRFWGISFLLSVMLWLPACHCAQPMPAETVPTFTETALLDDSLVSSEIAPQRVAPTEVSAEFVIDHFLTQHPDHIFYSDVPDNPYAPKILLTFSTAVTDFRFSVVDITVSESGELLPTRQTPLFTRDRLNENDRMVLQSDLGEILPTKAISFVNPAGNTQSFFLTISGKDNIPLLIPFE